VATVARFMVVKEVVGQVARHWGAKEVSGHGALGVQGLLLGVVGKGT